jgi:hypothetical protein
MILLEEDKEIFHNFPPHIQTVIPTTMEPSFVSKEKDFTLIPTKVVKKSLFEMVDNPSYVHKVVFKKETYFDKFISLIKNLIN